LHRVSLGWSTCGCLARVENRGRCTYQNGREAKQQAEKVPTIKE
jgi:hypothetical protein